jgi:hypothetical protein
VREVVRSEAVRRRPFALLDDLPPYKDVLGGGDQLRFARKPQFALIPSLDAGGQRSPRGTGLRVPTVRDDLGRLAPSVRADGCLTSSGTP